MGTNEDFDAAIARKIFFNPAVNNPELTRLLTQLGVDDTSIQVLFTNNSQEDIRRLLVIIQEDIDFLGERFIEVVRNELSNLITECPNIHNEIENIEKTFYNYSHGVER